LGPFSWSNGSRLYYANPTSMFDGSGAFRGFEAIGGSRTADIAAAAVGDKNAWMPPVRGHARRLSPLFWDSARHISVVTERCGPSVAGLGVA
jgi:hypothetical protein